MRVLIAPDKFAHACSADAAASAIARGWRRARPDDTLVLLPMADGGEGSRAVLARGRPAVDLGPTVDLLGRPITSVSGVRLEDGGVFIESADVIGIRLLAREERVPLRASSRGLAVILERALAAAGGESVWIGLGGSGTVDGGAGLLAGLGMRFLDAAGRSLEPTIEGLERLATVDASAAPDWTGRVVVLSDVAAPLWPEPESEAVSGLDFVAQKCRDEAQAEVVLPRVAAVWRRLARQPQVPGAGAAGGLGHALLGLGAALRSGAEVLAGWLGLDAALAEADLVVTGEGCFDSQSLIGKGPGSLVTAAQRAGKLAVVLAGRVEATMEGLQVEEITPRSMVLSEALAQTEALLEARAERVASRLSWER